MSEVGTAAKFRPFVLAGWKVVHPTPKIKTLNKVWEQILIASNHLQMSQVNNEKFLKNPISSSNGNIFILQILNDICNCFPVFLLLNKTVVNTQSCCSEKALFFFPLTEHTLTEIYLLHWTFELEFTLSILSTGSKVKIVQVSPPRSIFLF